MSARARMCGSISSPCARLERCEAELLALLRRLRAKRVAEIDAVACALRPAEPPVAPAPPTGGATPHPVVPADHRVALAQSAPPEDAPAPPSGPTLILHLTRAARGDRRAVALPSAPLDYHRHLPDGRVRVFTLDWPALIPHVTGLATARSADAVLGLGRALREALLPSGWAELEDALAETLRHGPALLLIQVNADELHSLPWEAMPLGGDGPPLAEARGLTILHHQPGVRAPPSPRGPSKAILLAWAGARGRVPAAAVEAALGEGVTSLASPRVEQLVAALSRGHHDALVLLAHGARHGDIFGLAWGDELLTPARLVAALRGLPKPPPRVILLACRSGDAPIGGAGLWRAWLGAASPGCALGARVALDAERRGAVTLAEGLARGDPRGALPTGSVDRLGVVVYGAAAPLRRLSSPAVGLGLLGLGLLGLGLITKLLISPTADPVEPPPPAPAAPSGDLRLTLLYLEKETPGASRSDAWADALGAALAQEPRRCCSTPSAAPGLRSCPVGGALAREPRGARVWPLHRPWRR
ncbi:MAG: hypothetical protein IPG17_30265, partial [Sandaracinaceae bacterium]|nr:hypothetical protein [Sandaracinaceae bacterium]